MVITEARKAYMKKYHQDNKEKIAKQQKEYKQDNKEKIKEAAKKHYQENQEEINENQRVYRQTPNGKKSKTISDWKRLGLVHDNYSELYDRYLDTNECDVCKYVFDKSNWRCMDHDHETGLFRQILCNKCNSHDNWKKLV